MEHSILSAPVLVALLNCLSGALAEILYTYSGSIGGGNYTYLDLYHNNHIHLMQKGRSSKWMDIYATSYLRLNKHQVIFLDLESLTGDADLYVTFGSEAGNASPTFWNYQIQSTTCGSDRVMLTPDMDNPVHIGIYGHSSRLSSKYVLHLSLENSPYEPYESFLSSFPTRDSIETPTSQSSQRPTHGQKQSFSDAKPNEESILWTIFVNILKIVLDILM